MTIWLARFFNIHKTLLDNELPIRLFKSCYKLCFLGQEILFSISKRGNNATKNMFYHLKKKKE